MNFFGANYVTIVNRSSKPVQATWDGKQFSLAPGKHEVPLIVAEAIKRQNPVMGTGGHEIWDGQQYLVGIVNHGDPTDPIEQSDSEELVAKDVFELERAGKQIKKIKGVPGLYGRGAVAQAPAIRGGGSVLSVESEFERP